MKTDKRQIGIYKILIGDVPADGVTQPLESAMTLIGHNITPDTVVIEKEDDSYEVTKNQENRTTDMEILTEVGSESFTFETWDMNFENMINTMGGYVDGFKWIAPVEAYSGKNVCVLIITAAGKGMHSTIFYPKMKMKGKANDLMVAGDPARIMYSFTKLDPEDASNITKPSKYRYFTPATPTNGIVDDTAKTFTFSTVENFTDVTLYEYSTDGGTSYVDVTVNPIVVSTAIAVGDLLVRVKENTAVVPNAPGYTLANLEEFTV